jgi:hypothetical protein
MKWFSLSIGLLVSTLGLADPVVKWQDANGQWHFGTAATAPKQQRTKPVYVEQPMSVVQNAHPLPQFKPSERTTTTPRHQTAPAPTAARLSKQTCDHLRESLKLRGKHQDHREAQLYYEQQCVMGRYYGDRSD